MEEKTGHNWVVEIPLKDGSVSMFIGTMTKHTSSEIVLMDAAWVAHTGRRHQFFAGILEGACQVEPYPDGVEVYLPAEKAILTTWLHPLLRTAI